MIHNKIVKYIRISLLGFGSILIVDSVVLFTLLKFNFGTVVPFFIGLIFLLHAFFWMHIQKIIAHKKKTKILWQALWLLFVAWLGSFILFVLTLMKHIHAQQELPEVAAVIVLGAGVNGDKPTPTLASRLDKANELIQIQPDAIVITTGGVGYGRELSEAYVMAKYLHDVHHVTMEHIQQEQQSSSTEENLLNSQLILKQSQVDITYAPIAIVTNDFHTIRAVAIAKKQGYGNVYPVASETPLSICFNAWFREYFAYISGWILGEY